ncbi:MAG: hypothetical protein JW807_10455 [Spirochaetes bacterium]|nr:hypothetical protein [Spirochaetota bacterium]
MDKRSYYSDDDVILSVCVQNESERNNYFIVYDSSGSDSSNYTTFQPVVFDMNGREAEITVPYKIENRNPGELLKGLERRMVELAPREIFIHTIHLKELFNLKLNTSYRVRSLFYPAFEENTVLASDNELAFTIIENRRYVKSSEVDAVNRNLSPKEVMLLTLKAEKDRDWANWLKYFNIEKYINAFPEYVQKYYRADFEEKSAVEKDFVKYLTRERDDYLIDFKILKEAVEKDRNIAYVDVVVDRFATRMTYRYKCRYTLEQYKNLWLITDEEATVMKGVKR